MKPLANALDAAAAIQAADRFRHGRVQNVADLDGEAVAALIIALTWADDLAGDYQDPRIQDVSAAKT